VPKPIEPVELVAVVASLAARANDLRFEIWDWLRQDGFPN
jgi:hypothetical protein